MTTHDKIKDEKVQHDINREAAKISALSSGKINKNEFLTGKAILPSDQSRMRKKAKFTYSQPDKAFEKQIETIDHQEIKQAEVLKYLKSEENKRYIKSIEGIFPKDKKLMKLKMK